MRKYIHVTVTERACYILMLHHLASATIQVANFGATIQVANFGATIQVANFGATIQVANFGATIQVANFGATIQVANFGATIQVANLVNCNCHAREDVKKKKRSTLPNSL